MKQKAISFFVLFFACLLLASCGDSPEIENRVNALQTNLDLRRFDVDFKQASVAQLSELKAEYPFFFPRSTPDSIWEAKLRDSLQSQLLKEVSIAFPSFDSIMSHMSHLHAHFDYHFQPPKKPTIYTLTNDVDPEFRVIATDSMWLIALDNYLGPTHDFYKTFPSYVRKKTDPAYLIVDMAAAVSESLVPQPQQAYFLSQMVYEGKKLFLQQLLWPHDSEAKHLHFTESEYGWALENEPQIWRYFLENKLLYSTEKDLAYRFLYPAPFSKFNLEIDRESPGQVGVFMGVQLVRSYYEKNGKDLKELLRTSAVDLLKDAAYKPKK